MQRASIYDPRDFLQTRGSASQPLDGALEYVRTRGFRLLPEYVAAMLPMSVIALFVIDAISAQHRSVLMMWCVALVPATLWRWAWLARIQQLVQQDVQARHGLKLRSRMAWILLAPLCECRRFVGKFRFGSVLLWPLRGNIFRPSPA